MFLRHYFTCVEFRGGNFPTSIPSLHSMREKPEKTVKKHEKAKCDPVMSCGFFYNVIMTKLVQYMSL